MLTFVKNCQVKKGGKNDVTLLEKWKGIFDFLTSSNAPKIS